ncbi:MAG: 8-oxo-dGTP pyrophosphatase MutT (NUDIX family) [Pseudomonadales bacterium]|jgi:8-oxo-dGTP pyrophosphatase MutT (NUDIX family)
MTIDNVPNLDEALGLPIIESAGGLVCNNTHHILLMFKRGKWDMPKGRVDEGATREESAIREVEEETGLKAKNLTIEAKLTSTWHTTSHNKIKYLKKTHWYLMRYDGNDDACPQIQEGIIECRWVHLSDLPQYRESLRARVNYVIDFWHSNMAYVPRP